MNTVSERSTGPASGRREPGNAAAMQKLSSLRDEVDACLEQLVPALAAQPTNLHDVMRYSLLSGGKRVRAILCILVSEAAGNQGRSFALQAGCAIEMVHAASLILDDLPCMDAASTRRGQPAAHKVYGVASSILASIGLLNRAYEVIAEFPGAKESLRCDAVRALTQAVGTDGMITGQDIDLHGRESFTDIAKIEHLNWLKTGVLFSSAAEIGAIAAELDAKSAAAIKRFSKHVGMAFQTADDLIDQHGTLQSAGKDVHQDTLKPTLVSLTGANGARNSCQEHLTLAREALEESGLDGAMLDTFVDIIFASHVNR